MMAAALCGCGQDKPAQDPPRDHRYQAEARPPAADEKRGPADLMKEVARLRGSVDGPVGIAIRDMDEGWTVETGSDRLLPQQSVSKLWVAMATYDLIDGRRLSMRDRVLLGPGDITLFHQPLGSMIGRGGYSTTVADLLERALTQSDNTANDRLLGLVGGPDAVRSMMRRKNITEVRFGPGERALQSGTAGLTWTQAYAQGGFEKARSALPTWRRAQAYRSYVINPPDGATARGIAMALGRLGRNELLSPASSSALMSTMARSRTGHARLKAGLTPGWALAHKTGTGQVYAGRTAGFNDVGVITAPDGHAYAVAVLIGDSSVGDRRRQRLIADVARAIVATHLAKHPVTTWTSSKSIVQRRLVPQRPAVLEPIP